MTISRGAARETAVLDAAADELAEHGFANLTTERVAARARASKATIYRHWTTKVDLVIAVAESMRPLTIPDPGPSAALRDDLVVVVGAVRAVTTGAAGRLLLALHEASRAEPLIHAAVDRSLVQPLHDEVAGRIAGLQRSGRITCTADPRFAARLIAAVVVDRALASGEPVPERETTTLIDDWLLPVLASQTSNNKPCRPAAGPG